MRESNIHESKKKMPERRSGIKIMKSLIGLVRPLTGVMTLAVILGTLGQLCAISLTVNSGIIVCSIITGNSGGTFPAGWADRVCSVTSLSTGTLVKILAVAAVLRGFLHYAEQYCNHFIAFRILAIVRHKVFAKLRELCPAKLDTKDKGNLIAVITSDIELLEVFYAHTISPIAIAVITSVIMVIFMGHFHPLAGVVAFVAYITAGALVPLWNGRLGAGAGLSYRNAFGDLNSYMLESLNGVDEIIQYGCGREREEGIEKRCDALAGDRKKLSIREGSQSALNTVVILGFSLAMLFLGIYLYSVNAISGSGLICTFLATISSFGPLTALSNLSNNLNQTLASGERILNLLEEEPLVKENYSCDKDDPENPEKSEDSSGKVTDKKNAVKDAVHAMARQVNFKYDNASQILSDFSMDVPAGKITGIHGKSGSGKSTLLKLFMRFRDVNSGKITLNGTDIKEIPTDCLRQMESFVTQETNIFHDTIENNIRIGKEGASHEEVVAAAKKASIHDFIMSLPDGYETKAGESGSTLSAGEKQRIGLARAFLHDAPFMLLDEPTSNLDSLNEGIILKSLVENQDKKTVLLVSHRKSTMKAADNVVDM